MLGVFLTQRASRALRSACRNRRVIGSTILVTGAGGFIGKDLTARLLGHGFHVRAMVRSATGSSLFPRHEQLQIVHADMRDQSSLERAVQGCTAVVHLAAAKADEKESEDINVGGARRLVRPANWLAAVLVHQTHRRRSHAGNYGAHKRGPKGFPLFPGRT